MTDTIGARSDAGKVLLGCPRRGPEKVGNYPHDGLVDPGVAGCLNSSGEFVAGAASPVIGISRGRSMNHPDRNSVTLKGHQVPIVLTDIGVAALGTITIDDYTDLLANADTIEVAGVVFTAQSGVVVLGEAKFRAATSNEATANSLAAQINGHEDASALVTATVAEVESDWVVTVTAKEKGEAGNAITFVYTDNAAEGSSEAVTMDPAAGTLQFGIDSYGYVTPGNPVFVDDVTGFAIEEDSGTSETNWTYASADVLEGINPAGGEPVAAALVNM